MNFVYNNTEGEVQQLLNDTENISRKLLCGGAQSFVAFFGIIGNIMSVIVFSRPRMNSSSDAILLGTNLGLFFF